MFSNLSSSSISLATVTPSLVMRGAPKLLSSTTLRPFGPSVTRTALARMSTPRSILSRASTENLTSLAAISIYLLGFRLNASGGLLAGDFALEHTHDVALFHYQVLDVVELDLGAGPFAEQHAVADLHVDRDQLAGLVAAAWPHRNHFAGLRLFLRRIGNDDPTGALFLCIDAFHDN